MRYIHFQKPFSISIHTLREEGDVAQCHDGTAGIDFYPRPPRGGRLASYTGVDISKAFLSTPSARRATGRWQSVKPPFTSFDPRLPRGGRPCSPRNRPGTARYFYPRPPRGGRQITGYGTNRNSKISIHALREEGDG